MLMKLVSNVNVTIAIFNLFYEWERNFYEIDNVKTTDRKGKRDRESLYHLSCYLYV